MAMALRKRFGPDLPVIVVAGGRSHVVAANVTAVQYELVWKPTRPAEFRALTTHLLRTVSVPNA